MSARRLRRKGGAVLEKIAGRVLRHRFLVLGVFTAAALLCALVMGGVRVNYDLADYLPDGAPSTAALEVMDEAFSQAAPNVRVYLPGVSLPEALAMKEKIRELPCVQAVGWLDDAVDIHAPLELADSAVVAAYYRDGGALFSVTADKEENASEVIAALRGCVGEEAAIAGETVDLASAQESTRSEIARIMLTVVPMALLILLLSTSSWLEPVLFIFTIGVSILMNLGTNLLFGEVSFITQGVAPILQLAVSMDYAIFLLNAFADFRDQGMEIRAAMGKAMVKSASAVLASGLTTVLGFLSLVVMRFKIGPDLGLVLAKGVLFSLVSVLFFLPVLGVLSYRLIDKTRHRPLLPSFRGLGRMAVRARVPVLAVAFLVMIPCYLAQQSNTFRYGAASSDPATKAGADTLLINDAFGRSSQMALLVPRGQWGREVQLGAALEDIPQVVSVISYVNLVGTEIPAEFVPEEAVSQLLSEHYSRFIVSLDMPDEGAEAFAVVERVRALAGELYGEDYRLVGNSVNSYDMMQTVTADNFLVNGLAILGIGLVLLLTFQSLSLPVILLLTIEASIWINLSFPYFMGTEMHYIGYLVISTVQLGATVDYAILFTGHYLENRKLLGKLDAARQTATETAASILVSAGILTAAGMMIGLISTNAVVSQLGTVLGRGAAISCVMVLLFLPAVLMLCDPIIPRTTRKLKFYRPPGGGKAGGALRACERRDLR